MTLVELLVVVSIVVVVLAAMIPAVKPALERGRIREASRQINTQLTLAKSLAVQRRLPVGLAIQRAQPGSNAAFDLFLVETPPPYAGDLVGATAIVRPDPSQSRYEIRFDNAGSLTANTPAALVQNGESFLVRFNYMGPLYPAFRAANGDFVLNIGAGQPPAGCWLPGSNNQWGGAGNDDSNSITNDLREAGWPGSDDVEVGLPFQVFLTPTRSAVRPVQLSGGTAIDLQYSGFGINGAQFNANNAGATVDGTPIIIMFSPGGAVAGVYMATGAGGTPFSQVSPTGSIYLLIGRFDQTAPPYDPVSGTMPPTTATQTNLQDLDSVWIAVETRSGAISTGENADDGDPSSPGVNSVKEGRAFVRTGLSMGEN